MRLVVVRRGNGMDAIHMGAVAVVDAFGRIVYAAGDLFLSFFMRSSAKPFQAMVVVESGAFKHYDFSLKQLAVMCGSHGGTDEHVDVVSSILRRIGLDESFLKCGTHRPIDRETNKRLHKEGGQPTPLRHNCSGKHAGMLAVARFKGWSLDDYWQEEHPVQVLDREIICRYAGVDEREVVTGIDGCSVVTFSLPLWRMAYMYARLGVEDSDSAELVRKAMVSYPDMVSYKGSFTTELMELFEGDLIAKSGAEGLFTISIPQKGWGIAVKIYDGSSRAVAPAVVETLLQLDLFKNREAEEFIRKYWKPEQLNHRGLKAGEITADFRLQKA